jgi:GNAT superfamily N-acetyltransferase
VTDVHYRRAREEELPATVDLFLKAVADVYERHGIKSPLPGRGYIETHYRHIFRTGIFYSAEVEGRLAAICHAVVRDQLWFLSGFWALPEFQGRGIGGQLLRRVRAEGEQAGARKFFTWSSVDLTAMGSYMRAGMLPGYQALTFGGTPGKLFEQPLGYKAEDLSVATAVRLDEQVRETGREIDHRFWLTEAGHTGRQVLRDGEAVGYYYFNQGTIGPAAWTNTEDASALLAMACRDAAAEAPQLRLMIPGINHTAIRFALETGLRLSAYAHLLTSAPFGRMEQYLASGPSLF